MFRRSPAFAAFCVLILGLGIGSIVSIFGVVNALLFTPLPYPNGDKVVRVGRNVSGPDWQDWHDKSKSFAAFATFRGGEVAVTVNGRAAFNEVYWVSKEFFDVFEVRPQVGRTLDRNSVLVQHASGQRADCRNVPHRSRARIRAVAVFDADEPASDRVSRFPPAKEMTP